jgi:hypothetical protein
MGIIENFNTKTLMVFISYLVYGLLVYSSIYIARMVLKLRNDFISENCNIVFRGYLFQDISSTIIIIGFILCIFLISNILVNFIIDKKYFKNHLVFIIFQIIVLVILMIYYLGHTV